MAAAIAMAQPALADDVVHYDSPADWVVSQERGEIDVDASNPIALMDIQQRVDDGTISVYVDQAFKLDSPEALTQAGTSALTWQPEKGSLVVHRVEILRGDETIDVLADGTRYSVIQRETRLEKRQLDGFLTATMPVPGLRKGDVLRVSYTQTLGDDLLQGNVQQVSPLLIRPVEATQGSLKLSWPQDEDLRWAVGPDEFTLIEESTKGGLNTIVVGLPLPKRDELPQDAPMRVLRNPIFQATTFADWNEVSAVFAPLYDTSALAPLDPTLVKEIEAIRARTQDPLERAALATEMVQSKISYLLNGMSGGNYKPQSPNETWNLRYGDCKAKTLLLLTMLGELGIEGEAVMVNMTMGDAVPETLPMPAAFDHVIVRAVIGGEPYYLDGTSAGTRLANIADTPDFKFYLPVDADGAQLQAITPRIPSIPLTATYAVLDQRAGVELPMIADLTVHMNGALASQLGAVFKQASEDQRDKLVDSFAASQLSGASVFDSGMSYDEGTGMAVLSFKAIVSSPWWEENGRLRQQPAFLPSSDLTFDPDRNRPAWKDIPVNLGEPVLITSNTRVLLPEGEPGYTLRGRPDIDLTFATSRVTRTAKLEGQVFEAEERLATKGGEWAAADLPAEKTRAQRIRNTAATLIAPADAARIWEYAKPEYRQRTQALSDAYQKAIDRDPDNAQVYINRGSFRQWITDRKGALADFQKAIELDATPGTYQELANTRYAMNDVEGAVAEARKAFEISPAPDNAMFLAELLGYAGQSEEAIALIEEFDDYGDDHKYFVRIRADVLAQSGRIDEGLSELTALIEEHPGDATLYNASCWYRARFAVGLDGAGDICDRAVMQASTPAPVLDSRAMAKLQMGDFAGAIADSNTALELQPSFHQTLYVKAFAERALGDNAAQSTIDYIAKTFPRLAEEYAGYGFKP